MILGRIVPGLQRIQNAFENLGRIGSTGVSRRKFLRNSLFGGTAWGATQAHEALTGAGRAAADSFFQIRAGVIFIDGNSSVRIEARYSDGNNIYWRGNNNNYYRDFGGQFFRVPFRNGRPYWNNREIVRVELRTNNYRGNLTPFKTADLTVRLDDGRQIQGNFVVYSGIPPSVPGSSGHVIFVDGVAYQAGENRVNGVETWFRIGAGSRDTQRTVNLNNYLLTPRNNGTAQNLTIRLQNGQQLNGNFVVYDGYPNLTGTNSSGHVILYNGAILQAGENRVGGVETWVKIGSY